MLNTVVTHSVFDEIDIFLATAHRVKPANMRGWLKERRIRTPLLDAVPGRPQLYWFGNIFEFDLITLATARGVNFSGLLNCLDWLKKLSTVPESVRLLAIWQNLSELPTIREVPLSASMLGAGLEDGSPNSTSIVVVDLSKVADDLGIALARRLEERAATPQNAYPTLPDMLAPLLGSHDLHQRVARDILHFVEAA